MTLEADAGVEEATSVGSKREVRRKCEKWFTPMWVSKPSIVFPFGAAITPALLMRILRRSLFAKKAAAPARMEARESSSMSSISIGRLLGLLSRISVTTCCALA